MTTTTILTINNCLDNKVSYIEGQYWMCCGTTTGYSYKADIYRVSSSGAELEYKEIKQGEIYKFSTGHNVKVVDVYSSGAKVTISTGELPKPYMVINTFTVDKSTMKVNENVSYEVCMENTGSEGNIDLYTGFGYKDVGQPVTFIGDGMGGGYVHEEIANVIVGEKMCPFGTVTLTQEVIDFANLGTKSIRFWTVVVPGGEIDKYIEISSTCKVPDSSFTVS